MEPCVTQCSAESGPLAAGIEPLYGGHLWAQARGKNGATAAAPLHGKHSLLIKSVTHFNRSSYIAAHSATEKKKAFKSSVACRAGEAGRVTRRGACVLMRRLPCQLKANSGPGISEPPPWAHRYWCWEGGVLMMVLAFSEMSHPHCCSFPMCTDCAPHEKKRLLRWVPEHIKGRGEGPFKRKTVNTPHIEQKRCFSRSTRDECFCCANPTIIGVTQTFVWVLTNSHSIPQALFLNSASLKGKKRFKVSEPSDCQFQ